MQDLTIVVFSFSRHRQFLDYCLKSVAKNSPPHQEIVLVWDDGKCWDPMDFDQVRRDTEVNFRVVKHSQIYEWPDKILHWGWIKQQLAKLGCWKYINTKYAWIVDGDVLITGDPQLFSGNRPVLRFDPGDAVPEDYRFFMANYLGISSYHPHTFVGSTALFDVDICRQLDKHCYQQSGMDLMTAVETMLEQGQHPELPFSEFECYGHYAKSVSSPEILPKNWNQGPWEKHWDFPIQIMWDHPIDNLQNRVNALMEHRSPLTA